MSRPAVFHRPHVVVGNLPYQLVTEAAQGAPEGGVLGSGRLVWTRDAFGRPSQRRSTEAFIEEIGTVTVDPRWLKQADVADLQ